MSRENAAQGAASVLCVDDDRDLAEVVQAILVDEGYTVSCLYEVADDALLRMVGRLEPDVVLLDSADAYDHEAHWDLASAISHRRRPIPLIMFTANLPDVHEAAERASARAAAASFAEIVAKPFGIDELLGAVARAAGQSVPFDRSAAAETHRTKELVRALEARGATEIRPSKMREWALFRDRHGRLVQLYWWQRRGVYQVGRYLDSGQLAMLGQFVDRDAAIDLAFPA